MSPIRPPRHKPFPRSAPRHVPVAEQRGKTAARGYDDPSRRYPSREIRNGVDVRRLPLSSFGKQSILVRLVAQWSFLFQATLRGLLTRRLVGVLASTSPPFCGVGVPNR